MADSKIRIKLKSYDHRALDEAAKTIIETATRSGSKVAGPIPLPVRRNLYCVLRSPHADKKSREHFEFRTHKRLIDIIDPTPKTVDSLTRMTVAAGVDIELKM